ncbi:hypothetical protein [Xenorhabdus bovienii]|nr:hypothetical protein [Xenorhabdus bovienii]
MTEGNKCLSNVRFILSCFHGREEAGAGFWVKGAACDPEVRFCL